jgi:hypothetical protein
MPFDLMRHDLLMTLRPVPPERITSIVDDLFLPLVAQFRPVAARAGQALRGHGDRRLLNGGQASPRTPSSR